MIGSRSIGEGVVRPYHMSNGLRKHKYFYERFGAADPLVLTTASTIAALPTAAAGQVDQLLTPAGNYMHYYQTTAQTLQPIGNASGLVLDGDQVNNESAEFVPGGNFAASPLARVIGTDKGFAIRATLELTDASGSDQLIVGWRKQEAFAVPTSFLTGGDGTYTDYVGLGFCATKANPNPVGVTYDLNNSGAATVQALNFTWADTKKHKLEVRVIAGKASYFINGVEAGGTISLDAVGGAITAQNTVEGPAFTFDSGDTVIPFIFVRHDTDTLIACFLRELEVGDIDDLIPER